MNSLGRHYRDPSDVENPTCNYELQGVKCSFFSTSNDLALLPYPEDVTLGPVSDPTPPTQSSDISSIWALLNQQKAEADCHRHHQEQQFRLLQKHQERQMRLLQEQVTSLSMRTATPVSTAPQASVPSFSSTFALSTATVSTTAAVAALALTLMSSATSAPYMSVAAPTVSRT